VDLVCSEDVKEAPTLNRILGIGRQGGFLADLDPLLESFFSELYVAPGLDLGLEMLRTLGSVDLVIVEHPLDEMSLREFQSQVRESSPTPMRVAVLVRIEDVDSLQGSDETDLIFLPFEESVEETSAALSRLLTRAVRVPVKLMVRLETGAGRDRRLFVAQTDNISRTGMLLRTRQEFDEKAVVGFEFFIPDDSHPISGTASVVRTIVRREDRSRRVAVHFQDLLGSDEQRLEAFLDSISDDA
jgi:hypothetical protein